MVIAKGRSLLPSVMKEGAAQAFNEAQKVAGSQPVRITDRLSKALTELIEEKQYGGQLPRAAQNLFRRVTNPELPELTYGEARRFYSNISRLSANELGGLNDNAKRLMGDLRAALGESIEQTAQQSGVGAQYAQGMAGYRKAAKMAEWKDALKEKALPVAVKGAIGAAGAGAVGYPLYSLYRLLHGE